MSSNDPLQRQLSTQLNRNLNNSLQMARDLSDQPFSVEDMYAFNQQLEDYSNANWASSQYTQFNFGIRKSIIDAIS